MQKLEDDFLREGGYYQTVRVSKLFNIISGNQPDVHNRFKIKLDGMVNTITGATTRNGINFYSYSDVSYNHELTIAKDGEYAGTVFLQTQPFIIGGHCMGMFSKTAMSDECKIYVASLINKIRPIWQGNDRPSVQKSRLENVELLLPFHENNIAFSYMENYIKTLEAERIETLEAYLTVTGLRDYHLTEKDEKTLDRFAKLTDTESRVEEWGTYTISSLFTKLDLRCKKKEFDKVSDASPTPTSEFNLPLINAKIGNNGIMFYGRKTDFDSAEMVIDIISNGAVATGTVYPQIKPVGVLWDAYLIKANIKVDRWQLLFLTTSIEKAIKTRFGWENKAVWTKVQHEDIKLPTQNNQPDYIFMSDVIKSIEKLVIKDMIEWLDKKIMATKEIVNP